MTKTLELTFIAANGKQSKLTFGEPLEPIDMETMKAAMDTIIAAKGVRVIERNVTEYEL